MSTKEVRVRIAPSPTGYFHIGTARTALFNWLFAKQHKGKFILRIEDTDLERSDPKFEADILKSMEWLGFDYNEGLTYQSKRTNIYEKYIQTLLEKNQLYHCFCSKEDLEAEREAKLAQGLPPKYSGKCSNLSLAEVKEKLDKGERSVLRLRVPTLEISFKDIIRGEIKFDAGLTGDIVVAKDIKTPLYDLAVVIDDQEMQITHVIRGEDHIPNTPKQIIIQEALGFDKPKYAHLPLILDTNRSKMSKRFAVTAVQDYQKDYLPEAFVNFLLLLGWHPSSPVASQDKSHSPAANNKGGKEKEIFTQEEMIKEFNLKRVQKGGAVFDVDKLNWLNNQYIKTMANIELAQKLDLKQDEFNLKVIALVKERLVKLSDFKELTHFFYQLPDYPEKMLVWKNNTKENALKQLQTLYELGNNINEENVKPLADQEGRGEVLWPLRVALSGQEKSPGPYEIMEVLGKEEVLRRVEIAIEKLQ
ncbi:MAG: glutamate--tRNA ligase [Patescibacteria group bacterium]